MKKIILFVYLLCSCTLLLQSQADWILKEKKEGISIYFRSVPNSDLKELKMSSTAKTTFSTFINVIENKADWMGGNFKVIPLSIKNGNANYNRTTIDFPFPLSDRDLISFAVIKQDPETKEVSIISKGDPKIYPEQKGYVRMPNFTAKWILKPLNNGELKLDYYLRSNPGGSIPTWVTNMLLDYGPFRTFQTVKEQLTKDKYKNRPYPGIIN